MGRTPLILATGVTWAMLTLTAAAQQEPIGPCSPYRGADGDVPSEMPGCARRVRPAPGSLADELQFRRARRSAEPDDDTASDGDEPSRVRARRPTSR